MAEQRPPLVYIMSPSYSGSTLLTILLARHPDVASIGELKASRLEKIDDYLCSCNQGLLSCPFWRALDDRLRKSGKTFDLRNWDTQFAATGLLEKRLLRANVRPALFEFARKMLIEGLPGTRHRFRQILEQNAAVMSAITELQGGSVFLDDSKDPNRALFFYQSNRWRMKVISLIRDGRGVTNSDTRHNRIPMKLAAQSWRAKIEEMSRVESYLKPEDFMRVRYEDLCSRLEAEMASICDFLGLERRGPAETLGSTKELHIVGNMMRLKPIRHVTQDEKWRQELSTQDLADFERIGGSLNRDFGYTD